MHKNIFMVLNLITVWILVGCGSSTTSVNSVKIFATVPAETFIEAFCEDGSYTNVYSVQNGINLYSFEIGVPQNTNCKLVMISNKNTPTDRFITFIEFADGEKKGSTISIGNNLNLFHIPLEFDYSRIQDTDGDHIVDEPLLVSLVSTSTIIISDVAVHDANQNGLIDAYEEYDNDDNDDNYDNDDSDEDEREDEEEDSDYDDDRNS